MVMLKQLFGLVLLSSFAVGRLTWNDRQLQEGAEQGTGNDWQYCEDKCNKSCDHCGDHHVCNLDEEIKCGDGPYKETPDGFVLHLCAKDEICVSNKCSCPTTGNDGELCSVVCECDCNLETHICCVQDDDANGCPVQPVCEPRGVNMQNEICPGFCVHACEWDQNTCEQPNDPNNGCPVPDNCESKSVDNSGDFCDIQQCTLTCEFTHHLCKGNELHDGCMEEDTCVPKQPNDLSPDGLCPGTCPVECQNGWINCKGQIDYYGDIHKGCVGQDICHVKAKDTNGQYCPDESDSHGCPKTCPEDEILCPPQEGQLGCKEEATCSPRSKCDDGVTTCPDHSDCPTVCPPHHINCPGGVDDCGCKKADLCIPEERDFNGDICPVHCPEDCDLDTQVECPGVRNPITGCKTADQCVDKGTHQWGETEGAECPGWCPAICNDHEILCPSMIDPCNGCPTEEICREAIKDKNGVFCPGKEYTVQHEGESYRENENRRGGHLSASHNCPVYCKEWLGETQCPVYEDPLGCKPEASCVMRQKMDPFIVNGEERWCPSTAVCTKECPNGEKLCHYEENDADGCHHEDICIPIPKDRYNAPCAMDWCPPLCSGAQTLQDNGVDQLGCPLPSTCV